MQLIIDPEKHLCLDLKILIGEVIERNSLCSISTVNADGSAHINNAFFCNDLAWRIFFISDGTTKHSININERESVALAICDPGQDWDDWKVGLQFFGTCRIASGPDSQLAEELYKKKFPGYEKWKRELGSKSGHREMGLFWTFSAASITLLHEENLGEETYITVSVKRF